MKIVGFATTFFIIVKTINNISLIMHAMKRLWFDTVHFLKPNTMRSASKKLLFALHRFFIALERNVVL